MTVTLNKNGDVLLTKTSIFRLRRSKIRGQ